MPLAALEKEAKTAKVATKPALVPLATVKTVEQPTDGKPVAHKPKSIWREIFEGHEEMLGWTPD